MKRAKEIYFKELDPQRHSFPDSRSFYFTFLLLMRCCYVVEMDVVLRQFSLQ